MLTVIKAADLFHFFMATGTVKQVQGERRVIDAVEKHISSGSDHWPLLHF